MVKLKISPKEARQYLAQVQHDTFREVMDEHWVVDDDGNVKASSANWLFCWAKTGQNSEDVADHVRRLFDGIMSVSFEEYDLRVPHEWARKNRQPGADAEVELTSLLSEK